MQNEIMKAMDLESDIVSGIFKLKRRGNTIKKSIRAVAAKNHVSQKFAKEMYRNYPFRSPTAKIRIMIENGSKFKEAFKEAAKAFGMTIDEMKQEWSLFKLENPRAADYLEKRG